jgi:hypothetical protein
MILASLSWELPSRQAREPMQGLVFGESGGHFSPKRKTTLILGWLYLDTIQL